MLEGLLIGLETAFSLKNLLMVIGGCLIGTFIGMLPGLGPMSIIAIMIPVAISLAGSFPSEVIRNVVQITRWWRHRHSSYMYARTSILSACFGRSLYFLFRRTLARRRRATSETAGPVAIFLAFALASRAAVLRTGPI